MSNQNYYKIIEAYNIPMSVLLKLEKEGKLEEGISMGNITKIWKKLPADKLSELNQDDIKARALVYRKYMKDHINHY